MFSFGLKNRRRAAQAKLDDIHESKEEFLRKSGEEQQELSPRASSHSSEISRRDSDSTATTIAFLAASG